MAIEERSEQEKRDRSKKMMLWFGIISMVMTFAGLTSAYVVSSKRPDWVSDFELPEIFSVSTVVIVLSSLTLFLSKKFLKSNNRKLTSLFLFITFLLGASFVGLQLQGFETLIENGYYFTGETSTINSSYIYVLVMAHLVHLSAGIIVLLVLIYNHFRKRYNSNKMLGFTIGTTFWHFVDVLWLFLFLFLSFYK
ncbi:cytochrome c oxidase subunit 3 [Flavobacterium sp. CS20]|jgi:cytochrome c oxidase subunit 3|uniref:cytochrome c oxidase subunit 3 n=1 Tax=Flavobacterium sp. CS20 TaxID=2775246 RepID=UPI001B39F8B8|nr:cytochrome c oxidase subunit 3 [Flavobacterium sp. CS20]QTY26757.1 heme-copper oxidase subunit III [Flavobacterium sp. CS20]